MLKTFKIQISGQVQGVGFRPFVYNLAQEHDLKGTVSNDENGVVIFANGTEGMLMNFIDDIVEHAPDAAIIQHHEMREVASCAFREFKIVPSKVASKVAIPLTADFAICASCSDEIQDPNNRRHQYPFTTCTQCGPRYAITERFPFEREHTNMEEFTMCESCLAEYQDPTNARFHSQTNSCSSCGVRLWIEDAKGDEINTQNLFHLAGQRLLEGAILAIKHTNGYLLCVAANNSKAVQQLRKRKQRPGKPFALLYSSLPAVQQDFEVTEEEARQLTSKVRPIVLLEKKTSSKNKIAAEVAPGLDRLGIMLPANALLTILMDAVKIPLVATSGNIHGSPILATRTEALEKLSQVADFFIHHDLKISFPQDDSVFQFAGTQPILLRRSRGLAPNFMGYSPASNERILAMGAQLKSTFAFTPNGNTYLSPYFGNLENYEVEQRFTDSLQRYTQIFEELPEVILVDKHPSYQSSLLGKELAQKWAIPTKAIQHHKAHFASILAEHRLFESTVPILGVIWDGTGYGDDGMIWGGEFFIYQQKTITRHNHFEYFPSFAGDKMAKEPRLSLFSLVSETALLQPKFSKVEYNIYQRLKQQSNIKTTSVGRLFDAVASMLGVIDISTYEGEAAMLLENLANSYQGQCINLLEGVSFHTVPASMLLEKLLELRKKGMAANGIAASFIYTLAQVILQVSKQAGTRHIACSGGVFQNKLLVQYLLDEASKKDLQLYLHQEVSSNDENIALGQLAHYQHINE